MPRFWVTHPCGQQWQTSYSSSGLSPKTPAPGIFFQPIFPCLARSPLSSSCRVGRWSWSGPLLTLGLHVKSLTNLGQRWRFAMERLAGFLPLIGFHWLLKGGLRMTGMWKMVCDPPQFLHLRPLAQSIPQVPKAGDEFSSFDIMNAKSKSPVSQKSVQNVFAAGTTPCVVTPPKEPMKALNDSLNFESICISSFANKALAGYIPLHTYIPRLCQADVEKLQKQLIILKEIQQLSFEIERVQRLKVQEEKPIKAHVEPYNVCHPPSVSTMSKLTYTFIFSSWFWVSILENWFTPMCTHVVYQVATTWRPNLWKRQCGMNCKASCVCVAGSNSLPLQ